MEFGIRNRAAFFAHARLAERAICFELPIVLSALDHISACRGRLWDIALARLRGVGLLTRCCAVSGRTLRRSVARCCAVSGWALRRSVTRRGAVSACRLGMGWDGRHRCQASTKGKLAVLLSIMTVSSEGRISLIRGLCGRPLVA